MARTFSLMKSTPSTMTDVTPASAMVMALSAMSSESLTWMCGHAQRASTPCSSGSM